MERGLIEALPLPAVLIAQDERILLSNAAAQTLLGEAIEGRHFVTVLRQPDVLDAIERCLRDGGTQQTQFFDSDGAQDTRFEVQATAVERAEGRAALVSFQDVTHLEQAHQMRRDFVANVSHELRTPLTSLMGFIETLKGPARNDPEATARFLDIMQSEAARMERLVRDLLSLSRVEADERRRPDTPVDIRATIRSVIHAMRPLAAESDVDIHLQAPETPVMAPADADQLAQVMSNLIENAIKYGGPDKAVTITLDQIEHARDLRGPAVEITVQDQGPGIEVTHLPRLTERFYRIDNHRSREMGGTGLGLAIVKHIINRHRGRLRIDSESGQGSRFRVILPA